jgi:hypothetical protein
MHATLLLLTALSICLPAGPIDETDIVVELLALLLRIQEVPGSDLGPETGYPD